MKAGECTCTSATGIALWCMIIIRSSFTPDAVRPALPKNTPPAKFVHDLEGRRGLAVSSLVSGGCIVSGSSIRRALLFTGVRVNSFSSLEDAVVLPRVTIGRNASLKKVVIDSDIIIPEGLVVGEDPVSVCDRCRTP